MERTLITIREYCSYHAPVAPEFIEALAAHGLIRPATEASEPAIYLEELREVERFSRMYYDLDINVPGIETIMHLLERMEMLQQELHRMQRLYGRDMSGLPDTEAA